MTDVRTSDLKTARAIAEVVAHPWDDKVYTVWTDDGLEWVHWRDDDRELVHRHQPFGTDAIQEDRPLTLVQLAQWINDAAAGERSFHEETALPVTGAEARMIQMRAQH